MPTLPRLYSWMAPLAKFCGFSSLTLDALSEAILQCAWDEGRGLKQWLGKHCQEPIQSALIQESAYLLNGQHKRLTDALADVKAPLKNDEVTSVLSPLLTFLQRERLYLKFVSLIRTGSREQAEHLLQHLLLQRHSKASQYPDNSPDADFVLLRIELERSGVLMGQGFYKESVARLLPLRETLAPFEFYSAIRIETLLGTCFQALGNFHESFKSLAKQEAMLIHMPSPSLRLPWIRRKLSYFIEHEEFNAAHLLLDQIFQEPQDIIRLPATHALFLQEKLRLALIRNDRVRIDETFGILESLVRTQGLSQSFLSLVEERCELDLRSGKAHDVLEKLRDHLWQAQLRGDQDGQCVTYLFLARALVQLHRLPEARQAASMALTLAEQHGYAKAHVRGLFYYSAIMHKLGQSAESALALGRAGQLARGSDLRVQAACHEYLQSCMERGSRPRLQPLVPLFKLSRSLTEVSYYLTFYGILPTARVRLKNLKGQSLTENMFEFIERLFESPLICYVATEDILLCASDGDCVVVGLEPDGTVRTTVRAFLEAGLDGLTLGDIHALQNPGVVFRSDRHASRIHMQISRVRSFLSELEMDVVYARGEGRYRLKSAKPLYFVSLETRSHSESLALSPRQNQLLTEIRSLGQATTHALCLALKARRQTLHPMLKSLENKGHIVLKKRGRSSFYVAI